MLMHVYKCVHVYSCIMGTYVCVHTYIHMPEYFYLFFSFLSSHNATPQAGCSPGSPGAGHGLFPVEL